MDSSIARSRNFYGMLSVHVAEMGTPSEVRGSQNGGILHGLQFMAANRRRLSTTYYAPPSRIGRTLEAFPRSSRRRVGVVGLGVGTLATYGLPCDYMRMYEINPDVLRMARDHFTFLDDTEARVEMVLGDARLSMEREAPQAFDILVLDAFSSDAIPIHLLTREAFEIYRRHLKPDGVIAVHFTSCHFDLKPVLKQAAQNLGMEAVYIYSPEDTGVTYGADWMLLTTNEEFLNTDLVPEVAYREAQSDKRIIMWTDDYSNLFRVLKF
jgi:spermidine synthase